jgi:hypothetical protein
MVTAAVLSKLNQRSQEHLQEYTRTLLARLEEVGVPKAEAACIVGNPPALVLVSGDFEKKRRSRAAIPYYERCSGRKADGDQCTRRRQCGSLFCGTHVKGTPYGRVSDGNTASDKIVVRAQEIQGIVHWIDERNNVYSQEDVQSRMKNPRIIAKANSVDGVYQLAYN